MLFCVDFDAGWAQRKQAICIFAEIEDELLRMESTVLRLVDLFSHENRN